MRTVKVSSKDFRSKSINLDTVIFQYIGIMQIGTPFDSFMYTRLTSLPLMWSGCYALVLQGFFAVTGKQRQNTWVLSYMS